MTICSSKGINPIIKIIKVELDQLSDCHILHQILLNKVQERIRLMTDDQKPSKHANLKMFRTFFTFSWSNSRRLQLALLQT